MFCLAAAVKSSWFCLEGGMNSPRFCLSLSGPLSCCNYHSDGNERHKRRNMIFNTQLFKVFCSFLMWLKAKTEKGKTQETRLFCKTLTCEMYLLHYGHVQLPSFSLCSSSRQAKFSAFVEFVTAQTFLESKRIRHTHMSVFCILLGLTASLKECSGLKTNCGQNLLRIVDYLTCNHFDLSFIFQRRAKITFTVMHFNGSQWGKTWRV